MNSKIMISTTVRLLALAALAASCSADADVEHSIGIARSDRDQRLQYIEHHQYFEDGSHRVDYYAQSMEVIAYKKLTYPSLPQHPRIEQEDLQRGTKTLVEPLEDRIRMVQSENGNKEEVFIERQPDVVCDAGFDTYIKSEWQRLVGSETTRIRFAIAGRSSTLAMKVDTTPTGDAATTGFTISPANWFVGMFVPSIELEYRNEDRKLMQYRGFSNLSARERDDRSVIISFNHYTTESRLQEPLARWLPDEVTGEPLVTD